MPDPHQLLDEIPDLICCFGTDGVLSYVNRAYADYFGSTPRQLIGTSFLDLVPTDHRSGVEANLQSLLRLTPGDPTAVDVHQGGDAASNSRWFRWTNKAFFDPDSDRPREFVGIGRDITDQREAEERTWYLASHDSLTGLVNRHTMRNELEVQLQRSLELDRGFGLLYLDLDGLKAINDRFGHQAGDDFIKQAANALLRAFRDTDIVGRIGGDEFVVVCPNVDNPANLESMVARARAELQRTRDRTFDAVSLGISAGCIICRAGETADGVLQRADKAMYADKQRRRDSGLLAGRHT